MESSRRGRGFARGGRGTSRENDGNSHLLGAIPKTRGLENNHFRGSFRGQANWQQRRVQNSFPHSQVNQHKRLDFQYLKKLTEDSVEPSKVIRCLGDPENDLQSRLKENAGNIEYLELIVVALGGFCKKNGTSQFTGSFVTVVKLLADQKVFAQITSIIINIPISRATNLPAKELRLKRLTSSVFHIVTEMLVVMPAFACNVLGQHFFMDIVSLKLMPSIQNLNVTDAFDVLQDGIASLETAWKQHIPETTNKEDGHRLHVERYTEELSLQDPPNDFRTLSVMPSFDDVCVDVEPFLRPNIVKGVYQNVRTYLDIQFRLLREDFFNPLRVGLLAHKNQLDRKSSRGLDNIRLYHQVKILEYDMNKNIYTIGFSNANFRRINWENSKRFLYGSLLLLSSDGFSSFHLFTVTDRDPRLLNEGKIQVEFEGENLPAHVKNQIFVMAESTVFFEAYRGVLTALQKISPANFPLEDYILGRKSMPELPDYLKKETETIYDLTRINKDLSDSDFSLHRIGVTSAESRVDATIEVDQVPCKQVHILDSATRPNGTDLGLDPSQTAALYAALTQKISVIQGPPGTGKTYLGLRIVEILLKNKRFWNVDRAAPILVICYTNHALDQFLEGISQFTQEIVRIGSRSKCEALESYSLHAWKKRPGRYTQQDTRKWIFEIQEKLCKFDKEREIIRGVLRAMNSNGLIHADSLIRMKVMPPSVRSKIENVFKSAGIRSGNWTLLGYWLEIYWNGALEQAVAYFNRNGIQRQHGSRYFHSTTERDVKANKGDLHQPKKANIETETLDDEWDEELVNEIQAARKLDDEEEDEDFLAQLQATKNLRHEIDDVLAERVFVNFDYKCSSDETVIRDLRSDLETLEKEDAAWMQESIGVLQTKLMLVRQLLQTAPRLDDKQLEDLYKRDFFQIPIHQRWMMYNTWKFKALEFQEQRADRIEEQYIQNAQRLKDVRTLESAEICQNATIVGFTTTGAAKQRALINHLKPKIVIVEEAAEVLEAHVVCALSSSCQQLILIGDHQQLRPPVTVYRLAKEFLLDVSLFERLIKNGMEPCILEVQHRMRPEIARLIVPSIYPKLENHSSVMEYPDIRGMSNNVFFLAHTELEKADHEGKSHLNPYEAELSLALARYLILQGYAPGKITILTTYSGQLLHFFKLRRSLPAVASVRISVVDNFQGEENDIIILSLVRSNDDENIGFLRIENRICVALSRAKQGFYMFGNMQNLQGKSKLWDGISKTLDFAGQLGPDLNLKCEIHNIITKVRKVVDFPPEGGCLEKCATEMACGHICPKICHSTDRDHKQFKCQENCNRSCSSGHPCPKKCFENCKCVVEVLKRLPCSHEQIVLCHKDPSEELCLTIVWKILPICGHGMDLQCGANPTNATCPSHCGMKLDCGHTCPLQCHKRSSHKKIRCKEPCQRTCKEQHPCRKICHVDCGKCLIKMIKMLPCGHEQEVECHQHPEDVICKVKVDKILPNCDHSIKIECGQSTDGEKCEKPCEKILCADGHACKKLCHEPCGLCYVRMPRELKCGHTNTVECYVDPSSIKCPVPKESKLLCGHVAVIKCGENPVDAQCPFPCELRLDCGHTCTLKCHIREDPDHETYKCMKPCGRTKQGCKMEHKCGKKCFETCNLCQKKWNRNLPCGHTFFTECHKNDDEIFCRKMMTKTIAECGHTIELMCSTKPTRDLCKMDCATILACGHGCMKKCGLPCNQSDCVEPVTTSQVNLCGHKITLTCGRYQQSGGVLTESKVKSHLGNCLEPCGAILGCAHPCKGTCGECFSGRVHLPCNEKCGRSLVCGHICDVNCGKSCPPCKRKCEYRCVHSKCQHKCCEPCSPCQETCQWKCEHHTCTKKCGEMCNRDRCDEICKKMLKCGHPCVGLCGEVCPPLCRVCNEEILTEIFLGNEADEDAKFVFLPDCGHCIEVEGMDNWMATDGGGQIQPKCCPRCKTPIQICMRYGNIIKSTFEDITIAKKKIFQTRGNPMEFFKNAREQSDVCNSLLSNFGSPELHNSPIIELLSRHCWDIFELLKPRKKQSKESKPSLGDDQRFQIQVNLAFIEQALQTMKKMHFPKQKKEHQQTQIATELVDELSDHILKLSCSVLGRDRISSEEYRAATNELDRLEYLRAFFTLQSSRTFPVVGKPAEETRLIKQLLTENTRVLDESQKVQLRAALETLGKKLQTGLGISDKERREIVQAMGLKKGAWYKCPNGHIYAIGDCGGANQVSRCNVCHATIGGSEHRLRVGNTVASEMDGATRPAWPQ